MLKQSKKFLGAIFGGLIFSFGIYKTYKKIKSHIDLKAAVSSIPWDKN
tara:strand:- start:35183 stop:35326 length:144 start_codon:yes stop_codon:yes gene_type:complete